MGLALHRAHADAEGIGGLALRPVLEEAQDDDGALFHGEFPQRPVQVDPGVDRLEWVGLGAWSCRHEHRPSPLRGATPPRRHCVPVEDLAQVGIRMVVPHLAPMAGQFDEGALQEILGFGEVAADEVCRPQPGMLAGLDEGAEVSVDGLLGCRAS